MSPTSPTRQLDRAHVIEKGLREGSSTKPITLAA
jgi:hypothetical protein